MYTYLQICTQIYLFKTFKVNIGETCLIKKCPLTDSLENIC